MQKRTKFIIIGIAAVAVLMLLTHLVVNTNWPALVQKIHGGG